MFKKKQPIQPIEVSAIIQQSDEIVTTKTFTAPSIEKVSYKYTEWLQKGDYQKLLFVTSITDDSSLDSSHRRCGIIVTYTTSVTSRLN